MPAGWTADPGPHTVTLCGCGYPPGDGCTCDQDAREVAAAFRPRDLRAGHLGPIILPPHCTGMEPATDRALQQGAA